MIDYREVQDKLIDTYMGLLSKNTIREMAIDSGIQKTRLFRIMNGQEMKLSEYITLKNRISSLFGKISPVEELAKECEKELSVNSISEISNYMQRRIRLAKLQSKINCQKLAA